MAAYTATKQQCVAIIVQLISLLLKKFTARYVCHMIEGI